MKPLNLLLAVLAAVVPILVVMLVMSGVLGRQKQGAPIVAEVTLDNRCEVPDRYFVVQDTRSGMQRSFLNGRARIKVAQGNPLTLQLQDRFTDVRYIGSSRPARAKMTLVAKCKGGGSRLSGISSSFQ